MPDRHQHPSGKKPDNYHHYRQQRKYQSESHLSVHGHSPFASIIHTPAQFIPDDVSTAYILEKSVTEKSDFTTIHSCKYY